MKDKGDPEELHNLANDVRWILKKNDGAVRRNPEITKDLVSARDKADKKYEELTRNNESYLWYFPNGQHATIETSTSPDSSPTDGWGSSAMLYALMEGVAGIVDEYKLYQKVRLSPRWISAGCNDVAVCNAYGASGASIEYTYSHDEGKKEFELEIKGKGEITLHLLLPKGKKAAGVWVNGKAIKHKTTRVEESPYADARFAVRNKAAVQIHYV